MGLFDAYVQLPTPPIPPYAELPHDYGDFVKFMRDLYSSDDATRVVAHKLWLEEGCPDGEAISRFGMKVKDLHWLRAKMMLDIVCDTDISTIWCYLDEWQAKIGSRPHSSSF